MWVWNLLGQKFWLEREGVQWCGNLVKNFGILWTSPKLFWITNTIYSFEVAKNIFRQSSINQSMFIHLSNQVWFFLKCGQSLDFCDVALTSMYLSKADRSWTIKKKAHLTIRSVATQSVLHNCSIIGFQHPWYSWQHFPPIKININITIKCAMKA